MTIELKKKIRFDIAPNMEVQTETHPAFNQIMKTMRIMHRKVKFK